MEEGTAADKKNNRSKKRLFIILGVTILMVFSITIVFLFLKFTSNHIPFGIVKAQNAVNFPIYYPSRLPIGFSLNNDVSATPQVVLYSFTYDKTKKISISIQPRANSMDENDFNPTKKFTTNIGTAYLVDMEDRTTAAVMSEKSWALINAPQKISEDTMEQLINSLRPLR